MRPEELSDVGDEFPDRVAASFTDKKVFITGGTGFTGKVLVEKLLRKCPNIGEIALLIRNKKDKLPHERLHILFNDPIFAKVTALRGIKNILSKIRMVSGDSMEPDLGLSPESRQYLIDNVDIIVHAAASVRFDDPLRKSVLLNLRGTKLVLELGKQCKKLQLFLHISTAYCHPHEKLLEEKPYAPPADPHKLITAVEFLNDDALDAIAPKLLKGLPNVYTLTKSCSEALAVEAMEHIPLVIVRPSIIIPILLEPIPGWTDNINGPTGLLIGAGKGVIRSMYCRSNNYADYVPVDIFINSLMIITWNYLICGDSKTRIYNCTSSAEVKVTWSELIDMGREIVKNRVPFNWVVWYPGGSMKHSRIAHNICAIFFHWIPAILVDTLLFVLGFKPVLLRVHRRISKGFDMLEYYANNQWDFISDSMQRVRRQLNPKEKNEYKIDSQGIDIPNYFEDCVRSARIFILKESEDTIPTAKRHMKVMQVVDIIVRYLFIGYILWILSRWAMSIFNTQTDQLQIK